MSVDEMLEQSSHVGELSRSARESMREAVLSAARADVARRAKVVRIRRRRSVVIGVAAAGAVVVGVSVSTSSTSSLDRSSNEPIVPTIDGQFRTVAQVVDAASAATPDVDPTAGPYWKVTYRNDCAGVGQCEWTTWNGIDRNGVSQAGGPGELTYTPQCPAALTIGGKRMPWREVNARTWTQHEIDAWLTDNSQTSVLRHSSSGEVTVEPRTGTIMASPALTFDNTVGILADQPASSTIKKQLWVALKTLPGIQLDGRRQDAIGRTGWQITLSTSTGGKESALVDITTGAVLELRYSGAGGQVSGGTSTATQQSIVSTIVSAGVSRTAPTPSNPLSPSACSGSDGAIEVAPAR